MSTPFQNRLVGTVIVAAAVVIFLPNLLDGKKKSNQADFEQIPPVPTFNGKMNKKPFPEEELVIKDKETVFNEQAQDNLLSQNKNVKEKTETLNQIVGNKKEKVSSAVSKVTPAVKPNPITAENTKPKSPINKPAIGKQPPKAVNKEAWVIQLGSFKHKTNVAELVTKLKKNGYTVFTKPIKTKQGTLTKVFVGPELIKATLTKKIPALKKLTNVQGKVARFYPTK